MSADRAETFGSLLREYRLAAGLSQEILAEQARISTGAVGALERGVRKLPQRQTLALLIEALQLQDYERERLSLAAVRLPQPRRRAGGTLTGYRGHAADLTTEASNAFTFPADVVAALARICERLERISRAIESAAEMSMSGSPRQRETRRAIAYSSRRRLQAAAVSLRDCSFSDGSMHQTRSSSGAR